VYLRAYPNPGAETAGEILAMNRRLFEGPGSERELLEAEVRTVSGREVAFLRYRGHEGDHEVTYTTVIFTHGEEQVAITGAVETSRWEEVQPFIDAIFANLRFGPVPPPESGR
jgi:hypothetical protein